MSKSNEKDNAQLREELNKKSVNEINSLKKYIEKMEKDQNQKNVFLKQKETELKEAQIKIETSNSKLNESEKKNLLLQNEINILRNQNASFQEDKTYNQRNLESKVQLISEFEDEKKEKQKEFDILNGKHKFCEKNEKVFYFK